jgi:predicted DNA binding CopG/RHH family protein
MAQIKYKDFLSRPLKLTQDELLKLIEEIYHRKFQEQSTAIKKNVNLKNGSPFQTYIYKFLTSKFKQQKHLT